MPATEFLPLYRDIRNSIDSIHDLAAAIETDLARLQIYQEPEAVPRALEKVKDLGCTIALLESRFQSVPNRALPESDNLEMFKS